MNITIKRPFLDDLKGKGFKEIDKFLGYSDWDKTASLRMDVGTMTEDELVKVVKVLKKDPTANANALNVIELWKKAKANPKDQKPHTLEQFQTILTEYLSSVPKFRLFKQQDDGDWMAYVATKVGYKPPRKTRDGIEPAFVWLKLAYYQRGEVHEYSVHFYNSDVKGKRCSEIIDAKRLVSYDEQLDKKYEAEVARYKELRGSVGRQMWGSGYADVVGNTWYRRVRCSLDVDGRRSKVVIDSHVEGSDRNRGETNEAEAPVLDGSFWKLKGRDVDDDDEQDADRVSEASELILDVPLVPEVIVFNLEKHEQAWVHVNRLDDYVYDETMGAKLVLPKGHKDLVEILVSRDRAEMKDIVSGKAGGSIVLCSGYPGTGKTLTAEVFSETIKRPLYVVASSQLGTNPSELESELKTVLDRASRLGAIMLIDEADVFIHERGDDMVQNAVVGVFLRVLEYYNGVLFLTTNRATIVDDAIVSRCTAEIKFQLPTQDDQVKIWKILASLSSIKVDDAEVKKFVRAHPKLSGRDVKGLLKLANMVSVRTKDPITAKLLEGMMQFKPTFETSSFNKVDDSE